MIAPLISYVTFNRKELVENSLNSILNSSDDFELHIIDNHSTDGTWEYLKTIKDDRIKCKTRLALNHGPVFPLNINISKRQEEQHVITIDSSVIMQSCNWISRITDVFENHEKIGVLEPKRNIDLNSVEKRSVNSVDFYQLKSVGNRIDTRYIPMDCMAISYQLLDKIGYFSEENYFGEQEFCYRVLNFTDFKIGYVPFLDFVIQQNPPNLDPEIIEKIGKLEKFRIENTWKFEETKKDMLAGARPIYCASMCDLQSMEDNIFNELWATENIGFFAQHAS